MRFLVALYNEKTAPQLVQFTAMFSSRLGTDMTFLYVEPEKKRSMSQEMQMAREKMSSWHLDSTGLKVLRAAREHLVGMGVLKERRGGGMMEQLIVEAGDHYVQYTGEDQGIDKITFRYREGDALSEILAEMNEHHHEILTIGSGKSSDFLTRLLKFSNTSILIVKNPKNIKYKLLAATDGTPPSHRAELLAIKTASYLGLDLTFLSVSKSEEHEQFMQKHLERMGGLCKMKGVNYNAVQTEGNVVEEITKVAGEDHIIFLGRSRRSQLAKLFFGSKTIKTVQEANCPLLLFR